MDKIYLMGFANCKYAFDPRKPLLVEAVKRVCNADYKTGGSLDAGESAMAVGVTNNLYGRFLDVRLASGRVISILPRSVKVSEPMNGDR